MVTAEDEIAQLEEEREALLERVAGIDVALSALRGGVGTAELVNAMIEALGGRRLRGRSSSAGVGDDKLHVVRRYAKQHGRFRQADVVHATGYNSGSISVALERLEALGEVAKRGKENRSRVWEYVGK